MSENNTNRHQINESEPEDMLNEYNFSKAKPGRYRGVSQGKFIRVLADGTEQVIQRQRSQAKKSN